MGVTVNTTRKAVEISWDPTGGDDEPEVRPPEFPEHPMDPPVDGEPPIPAHPIYLPPYVDNSLPEGPPGIWGGSGEPFPGTGLPGDQPGVGVPEFPTQGLPGEQPEVGEPEFPTQGLPEGDQDLTGNLPPAVQPVTLDETIAVQIYAQGSDSDDWANTAILKNDGLAVLTYPEDFAGESYVEVRALDGRVVDSGTISVS